MADTKEVSVPKGGDHDRVSMLSIDKTGTANQHDPEIIGDREFAVEATKRQFRENAVSAVDVEQRTANAATADEVDQDPGIADLKKAHDSAAKAAESAAEKVVGSLHKGD
jgi:hypothetical protein